MGDEEAKGILRAEFVKLQAIGYEGLVDRLAGKQERSGVTGLSGKAYQVEREGFWEEEDHQALRIVASIDDGGLRALLPFTESFTIAPTGAISDHSTA